MHRSSVPFVQGSLLGQQTSKRRRTLFPELEQTERTSNGVAAQPSIMPSAVHPLSEITNNKGGPVHLNSNTAMGQGTSSMNLGTGVGASPGKFLPQQSYVSSWQSQARQGMSARSYASAPSSVSHTSPSSVPAQSWNDGIFNLSLPMPTDLPRLTNAPDLLPSSPAEMLFKALPQFPAVPARTPPTAEELAKVLGFVELPLTDPGHAWPPLDHEFLEDPREELCREASVLTSLEAVSKLEAIASRWEAQVQHREELRVLYDWSFEKSLHKPCQAIIDALSESKKPA